MKYDNILWLEDMKYQKAMGQMRLQVGAVLHPLRIYGQGVYVDGAVDEIMKLVEDFGLHIRGAEKPISIDYVRRQK